MPWKSTRYRKIPAKETAFSSPASPAQLPQLPTQAWQQQAAALRNATGIRCPEEGALFWGCFSTKHQGHLTAPSATAQIQPGREIQRAAGTAATFTMQ